MPQIGPLEILVVAVIALIVFGPEKLPELARKIGRTASELRRLADEAKEEFQAEFDLAAEEEEETAPRAAASSPASDEVSDNPSPSEESASVADSDGAVGAETSRAAPDAPKDEG